MTEQELINEEYTSGKKSFDYVWHQMCENFDFDKIYQVMKSLDWVWHFGNERYGVPSAKTIILTAKELMQDAYNDGCSCSTGGLSAGWDSGEMYLSFQVEGFQTLVNVEQNDETSVATEAK